MLNILSLTIYAVESNTMHSTIIVQIHQSNNLIPIINYIPTKYGIFKHDLTGKSNNNLKIYLDVTVHSIFAV